MKSKKQSAKTPRARKTSKKPLPRKASKQAVKSSTPLQASSLETVSKLKFELLVHREAEHLLKPIRVQLKKIGMGALTLFRRVPTNQALRQAIPYFVVIPIQTMIELVKGETTAMDFVTWMNKAELKYPKAPPICIIPYRKAQIKRIEELPIKANFVFVEETLLTSFPLFSRFLAREISYFKDRKAIEKSEKLSRTKVATPSTTSSAPNSSEEELISKEILKIGLNISKERDTVKILEEILINSMRITHADAGSIAIRGMDKNLKKTDQDVLTFYISKNISHELHFSRFTMPVSEKSLGGYTILTGKPLNIRDAYLISSEKSYSFNRGFDEKTKFRTKSVLVVPMINQKGETIGIIQLMNKKDAYLKTIDYDSFKETDVKPFNKEDAVRLTALASLATISLQNAILYNEIDSLFHGFVAASVSAVEQRDPATSGHSSRVARFSTLLAKSCNKAGGVFDDWNFTTVQMRELEYASLLHDFGKIGVRENILLKSHKMESNQFNTLLRKFDVVILNMQLNTYRETVDLFREGAKSGSPLLELEEKANAVKARWEQKIAELKHYRSELERCNEGIPLTDELRKIISECSFMDVDAVFFKEKLITNEEEGFLSIPYGTLSGKERLEIQSHVSLTFEFLKKIPWTEELKQIPEIAHFHHEKLDGTGYPIGITSDAIPNQTKIMTICDIYDALTSADRPYKKSMDHNKAISILRSESESGKLHPDLLDLFIRSKILQKSATFKRPKGLETVL